MKNKSADKAFELRKKKVEGPAEGSLEEENAESTSEEKAEGDAEQEEKESPNKNMIKKKPSDAHDKALAARLKGFKK